MAEVDYLLATWITNSLVYIIIGVVVIWFIKKKGTDIRHRWFAFVMNVFSMDKDPHIEEIKKNFFSSLGSITSHDPELRKKKAVRILEIGVGTGVNFSHYPDGTHLIVVDPNPHFAKYYNKNRKNFPNISSEDILVTTGEEMNAVGDGSVDVVVMTLVLCSVQQADKIMQEILRVLVPGGKFYFYEHIREFDPEKHWVRQKLQDILTASRVWPFIFDGCCLNRDMLDTIQAAGFSKVDGERFYAPLKKTLMLIKPHLKGVAEK